MLQYPKHMEKIKVPNITLTLQIFREGRAYVAYARELDVSSCGKTTFEAKQNLKDAILGFVKSAYKMGTLKEILDEAGYRYKNRKWLGPELVATDRFALTA